MFTFRRVEPSDKSAILGISSRIWEGNDYVPEIFDEWVADRGGEFTAVLHDGGIAGFGKLTFFTTADAWLEGLRKHPDVKEKGLAEALARYYLSRLAALSGIASVRFSTYVKNLASIAVNERLGFQRRVTLSCKVWTGNREEAAAACARENRRTDLLVEPVTDERAIFDFIEKSGYFNATGGLAIEGWRARPFSREPFASRYIRTGHCRGVRAGGRLAGLSVFTMAPGLDGVRVRLVMLDAADEDVASALFEDLFLAVKSKGSDDNEIELQRPRIGRISEWFAARGFRSWELEDDFLVFELPLSRLAGFASGGAP